MKRKAVQGMFAVCRYTFLGVYVPVRPPLSRLYQSYCNALEDMRRGAQSDEQEIGGVMELVTPTVRRGNDEPVSLWSLPVIESVRTVWPLEAVSE